MEHATKPGKPGATALSRPAPPTRTRTMRNRPTLVAAIKTLHRFEVGPVYFFVLVWGMFVAARRPGDLWSAAAILAIFINGLSLFSGFVLNNYSDYPIDRRSQLKGYIADAVERVGLRNTLILYWIEQAVTVAAAAAVSVLLHNWLFVVVKLVGIVAGMMYNGEPLRMKRRGIWNPILFSIRFGFVPGMIAYFAVHEGTIGTGGWLVLVGATLLSFSRGFWNSVSDTDEDRAENIVTAAVRYGARAAMTSAVVSLVPACLLIGAGLWLLFGPPYALAGAAGATGATIYRCLLLRSATDDRGAIVLLKGAIRRVDTRWSQATYWTIALAGLIHMIVVSRLPKGPTMITLVKIGGSVLTDKKRPLTFQDSYARCVAADIRLSRTVPVIVHGTGSWAKAIGRHYRADGGWFRDAAGFQMTCWRIRRLQEALTAALRDEGVLCCPLQANAIFHRARGTLDLYDTAPLSRLVDAGVSPLLCGDLLVEGPGTFRVVSSDAIAVALAGRMRVSDCVFATDVDGVWDDAGHLIREMTEPDLAASDSDRRDVTGGMPAKVAAARDIAATGARTTIVNGRIPGRVRDALARHAVTGTLVTDNIPGSAAPARQHEH